MEQTSAKQLYEFMQEARRLVLEFVPILTAIDDQDVTNEAVITWVETFKLTPFFSADEGSLETRFGLFLRSLIPVTNVGNVRVRAGLVRDYGKNTVTFEIEDYAPRTQAGIQAGFDRCLKTVKIEHDRYVSEFLAGEKNPEADKKNTEPATDVEVMPVDTLSIRMDNGKLQVRAHGGRFTKWGVPVYEETLTRAELDPESIPVKGLAVKGNMHILMQGGKPRKVTALELA